MRTLVGNLLRANGITAVDGQIVGDESYFDSLRGTPATGFARSTDVEGELSALAYDRGFANIQGTAFELHPAVYAAQQLAGGLRAAGVKLPGIRISAGGRPPAPPRWPRSSRRRCRR